MIVECLINEDAPKSFVSKKTLAAKNQKAHLKYLKKKKNKINNATAQHELPKFNQMGEVGEIEEIVSTMKIDYHPKGKKWIVDYKDIPLCQRTILSYRKDCDALSHIRYEDNIDGCILTDGVTNVVGAVSVEEKNNGQKWLQTLEITKPYRGYGLSNQILKLAVLHYGARYLSVDKSNEVAIHVFEQAGFKPYAESDDTIFMKIDIGSKSLDECTLLEAVSRKDMKPIFIVNSWTNTPFGRLIRLGTQSIYTHSSLSLDTSMERLYTFNADNKINKLGGMSIESLRDYIDYFNDAQVKINCFFVKTADYNIIKQTLDHMVSVQDKTTYDFLNIVNIIFGRAKEMTKDTMTMVCSQFVSFVASVAGINLISKSANLITPKDLANAPNLNPKIYSLYEGLGREYKKSKIDRIFRKLKQKAELIKEGGYSNE